MLNRLCLVYLGSEDVKKRSFSLILWFLGILLGIWMIIILCCWFKKNIFLVFVKVCYESWFLFLFD